MQLLEGFTRHKFSPVEVLKELADRIERFNPILSSYISLNLPDAMNAARRAEELWLSPGEKPLLCGVPVSVKDTIEVAGLPTTYGSVPFKGNYQGDSEIAKRLRRAGAVILGKTNTSEFARGDYMIAKSPRNPWNVDHIPGGSSAGAASSVAAGLGPLALGTDSGGSIRRPASYNGVFGMINTYQRIPSVQRWRAAPGRSHNGLITRTVRDTALLFQALAGPHPLDPDSDIPTVEDFFAFSRGNIRGLRVAVSYDFGSNAYIDDEARALVRVAASLLEELGCEVMEANPPVLDDSNEEMEPGVWGYSGDHYAAAESLIPGFWEKHAEQLGPRERHLMEPGRHAQAWRYRLILRRNRAYERQLQLFFRSYDFILCPSVGPAPRVSDPPARDRFFTFQFNHAHTPACVVPFGFHSNGMPLSVQLVGSKGDDVGVLRMAGEIEASRPWAIRWPSLAEDLPGSATALVSG